MREGKLRVGIVGANWGVIAHLPAWRNQPDVEVVAVCTSRQESAEEAARQYGIARPFWNYETMAADPAIDIIDTGLSPVMREKIVTAALTHGKHVVNQLPFAPSFESAQRLVALQQDKGVVGAAACSMVGLPHIGRMKQLIEEGYVGDVYQVHISWQLGNHLNIFPGYPYLWFAEAGHGVSVTRNQGSHLLHTLRHVFGPIDSVSAQIANQHKVWTLADGSTKTAETDDSCHALLRFTSGAMGTLQTSWTAADSPGFFLDVLGSKGRLRIEALRYPGVASAKLLGTNTPDLMMTPNLAELEVPEDLFAIGGRLVATDPTDPYNGGQRISLARLFESFAGAIRNGGEPVASFARSLEIQGLVEALYESDRRGVRVTVGG